MKKILIAVPTSKYIETETFKSIYDLDIPEGVTVDFESFYGYNIAQIRNLIFNFADKNNYDYVLNVDSDMVLPQDTLSKLLEADKDIVTGVYRQRNLDYNVAEIYVDLPNGGTDNINSDFLYKQEDIFEVAGAGFGCILVSMKVIRDMDYPHFVYKDTIDFEHTVSEDTYFCEKARSMGYSINCIPTLQCGHIGSFTLRFK